MKKERLIKNIMDQIKEAQMKLGFVQESIRLYFPWESFLVLLGESEVKKSQLLSVLNDSPEFADSGLGQVVFRESMGRVEVTIPPEGAEYIHRQVPEPAFLKTLIQLFGSHHSLSIEAICHCFENFSSDYVCREIPDNDFDYVLYFQDQEIDSYYYCIKMEMGHTIYHRFIKEDYEKLME